MNFFAQGPGAKGGWLRLLGLRLATLFVGQTFVQGINFLTGLLLVRCLAPDEYARYSLVFAFQCTLALFVDLGFGSCIISLAGPRGEQPEVVGGYIAAARWFRMGLFALVLPVSAVAFYGLGARQGWPLPTQGALFACVALSLYFDGISLWFSIPLLIHGQLREYYRTQVISAVVRLGMCLLAWTVGILGAVSLAIINTAAYGFAGWRYQVATRHQVVVPARADPVLRREMLRYMGPLIPAVAFTAVQGQLGVFLITYFGKSQNVAEVAALSRLGQFFLLLEAVNAALVTPHFARLPKALVARQYLAVLGAALIGTALLTVAAFLCPWPLLWLLGGSYQHLEHEFGWMVAGNGLGYISLLMWHVHSARKWVFWWGTALYIALVSLVQVIFIARVDLSTTLSVQFLTVATASATVLVHALTAIGGFRWERRSPDPDVPLADTANVSSLNRTVPPDGTPIPMPLE